MSKPGPLALARNVILAEASALTDLANNLAKTNFLQAVDLLFQTDGRIHVTGIGKSGDIARKMCGTLTSTGSPSHFLDATNALHGDLGTIMPNDVVVVLSQGGLTEELIPVMKALRARGNKIVLVTSNPEGKLATMATVALDLGVKREADPRGLAPSTSTTAMAALGDALAFVLADRRQFSHRDFALHHPAGSLGKKLASAAEFTHGRLDYSIAQGNETVGDVIGARREGAPVLIVDKKGKLIGIFSDTQLTALLRDPSPSVLSRPVSEVMGKVDSVAGVTPISRAAKTMRQQGLGLLPVVDAKGRPTGLLHAGEVQGLE